MAPIPGGPEDKVPPKVVSVTPDTNAVDFHGKSVEFKFDGVVSDRSGPTQDLNGLFLISPRDGAPHIDWHRDHIDVRPKGKWLPNTAYTVTLLPGLADLSNNVMKDRYSVVFSTGPTIPAFGALGRVFDWSAQQIAPNAVVEAISRPDSVVYVAMADSTGQFRLGPFAAGKYTIVAFIDQNHDLQRGVTELWDSTQVDITTTQPYLEMLAAKRDTIGPAIAAAEEADSVTIRVTFDKPLDPNAPIDTSHFRLMTADSVHLTMLSARTLAQYQADRARERADSVRVADSLAALRDTTKRAARPPAPKPAAKTDSGPPKPSKPAPATVVMIDLALGSQLPPQKQIRVTATDIVNLLGYKRGSTRVFATPKPPEKSDTTKAKLPADTSRARAPGDSAKVKLPPDTSRTAAPKKPGGGGRGGR